MSLFRTPTYVNSAKFQHALAGSAVAVVAAVVGTWPGGAPGQPAATARPVGASRPAGITRTLAASGTTGPSRIAGGQAAASSGHPVSRSGGQPARLDAFLATASQAVGDPAVIAGAVAGRHVGTVLTAREIAIRLLHRFGWSRRQLRYLDPIWARESGWNVRAENFYSGAYGIPQAVPGSTMASAGPHWRSRARTQIVWGCVTSRGDTARPRSPEGTN